MIIPATYFFENNAARSRFVDHSLSYLKRLSFRDITEIKRSEEKMRIINGDLPAAYEKIAATEEELRQNYDELNRKEQKLREREEKYCRIIETADEGTCILDSKFQVNDRRADILDLEPHEIGGRLITDFIHADDLPDQEHHGSLGRRRDR